MKRNLLAFVHIEKSAGSTLKWILGRNFGLRYCEVRTLSKASRKTFSARDLRLHLLLNPFISCVAGHSVKPWSDLEKVGGVDYITILRNPVQRYISYYSYGGGPLRAAWPFSFDEYLEKPNHRNFQTRKIVGTEDADEAKRVLSERFLSVGVAEDFDSFLVLLKRRLALHELDIRYIRQNVQSRTGRSAFEEKYKDQIIANNEADLALYRFVKHELLPAEKSDYGEDFEKDLSRFTSSNTAGTFSETEVPRFYRNRFEKFFREKYIRGLTGLLRKIQGLHPRGVY